MGYLNDILGRPAHERPFLMLVVGYTSPDARVPAIAKKPLEAIAESRRRRAYNVVARLRRGPNRIACWSEGG